MENDLQVFKNDLFEVALKLDNGEVLFDVERVAKCLGISRIAASGNEVVRWDRVNKYLESYPQVGTVKNGDFIPEAAVYKLAFKASNEVAEKFQDWLAVEVLPSIRKHGMYATEDLLDNPDLLIAAATRLKEERAARLEAEKKVENLSIETAQQKQIINELQPKATYYDLVLQNPTLIPISVIAKDYGMSGTKMNELLHEYGVQYKMGNNKNYVWLLYSKYQDKGYTFSKTQPYIDSKGVQQNKPHTYWTQKGRLFIYDLLKQHGIYPLIESEA